MAAAPIHSVCGRLRRVAASQAANGSTATASTTLPRTNASCGGSPQMDSGRNESDPSGVLKSICGR